MVLTACLSVVLLAPEFLLPMKCGLEVPMRLRLALALGADPTIGYAGPQLLRYAACLGNEEVVQLLQEAGYSLNEENEIGQTPLEVAFHAAHRDVYRVLVAAGADETALRQKVGEVVYLAQFGTPEEVVAALPAATKEQQRKALRTALDCRRADVAHALVDAGVSLSRVKPSSAAFDTVLLRRVLHGTADKPPGWTATLQMLFFGRIKKRILCCWRLTVISMLNCRTMSFLMIAC